MVNGILELAEELVVAVIEQIDDLEALRSLARTCSRLRELAEPKIYRHLFLRSRHDAARLARSIVSRHERLREIRSIDARLAYCPDDCRLDSVVDVVRQASNLRQLTVESPYCNHIRDRTHHGWDESMHVLLRPVFDLSQSRLTSLTLHLSLENERYWTIDERSFTILSHPTLISLKLSCARLTDNLSTLLHDRRRTPLKQLIFIECGFQSIESLASVLALPAALEHLSLGENCKHRASGDRGWNMLWGENPPAFFGALAQQRHSLKKFGYATISTRFGGRLAEDDTPDRPARLPDCGGFSSFHCLTELSVSGVSLKRESILKVAGTAPPALQRLLIREYALDNFLREDAAGHWSDLSWVGAIAATVQSLHDVVLITSSGTTEQARLPLLELCGRLRGRELTVRVWKRSAMGARPPYLHDETPHCDEEMARCEEGKVYLRYGMQGRQMHDCCLIYG